MSAPLTFGLPGSMGAATAVQRAFLLEEHLTQALGRPLTVRVCPSYEVLERDLLSGDLSAAWSPPLVVARVEAGGGQVAVRGIRSGCATYRAVLVARRTAGLRLAAGARLRAAWTDPDSIAGCLLPRAHVLDLGAELAEEFHHPTYVEALEAVLRGDADLTSTWASSASAATPYVGYRQILGERAAELEELGYTRECPNDAIVFSPNVDADGAQRLWGAFLDLTESPEGQELARLVFGTERFAAAPAEEYREIGAFFGEG
jgi:ABC-type phosphate/phosphonate transport system substrate-binding protein